MVFCNCSSNNGSHYFTIPIRNFGKWNCFKKRFLCILKYFSINLGWNICSESHSSGWNYCYYCIYRWNCNGNKYPFKFLLECSKYWYYFSWYFWSKCGCKWDFIPSSISIYHFIEQYWYFKWNHWFYNWYTGFT